MTDITDHGAPFQAGNWTAYLGDEEIPASVRAHIQSVIGLAAGDSEAKLRRRHVFGTFEQDTSLGVVASIMWGYPKGRRPGGASFKTVFAATEAIAGCVSKLKARTPAAEEVCAALGRFAGLGPSTYTKIAYFAGIQTTDGACLIYDQMVMRSIAGSVEPLWQALSRRLGSPLTRHGRFRVFGRPVHVATYGEYLRVAGELARIRGTTPAHIEMDLFLSAPRGRRTPFSAGNDPVTAVSRNLREAAPTPRTELIAESDCSIDSILDLLDRSYFESSIDLDGDLYVKEGIEFPIWIRVLLDKKLIEFSTFIEFDEDSIDDAALISCAAKLNSSIVVPAFFASEERLRARYFMTYAGGIFAGQFVSMLRRFSSAFALGMRNARSELVPAAGSGSALLN